MEHGTVQMYRKELREKALGGPGPCEECKAAQASYIAGYRLVHGRERQSETATARIRRKAASRLAQEYPERYAELVAEESALSALL